MNPQWTRTLAIVVMLLGGRSADALPQCWKEMSEEEKSGYTVQHAFYSMLVERKFYNHPEHARIDAYAETKLDRRFDRCFEERGRLMFFDSQNVLGPLTLFGNGLWDHWRHEDVRLAAIEVERLALMRNTRDTALNEHPELVADASARGVDADVAAIEEFEHELKKKDLWAGKEVALVFDEKDPYEPDAVARWQLHHEEELLRLKEGIRKMETYRMNRYRPRIRGR